MTTETTIRLQETHFSTCNVTTMEKEATGLLIVGKKGKDEDDDIKNLFVGYTLFG